MDIYRLKQQFTNEDICRKFFENSRWPNGRICPHCGFISPTSSMWVISTVMNVKNTNANLQLPQKRPFTVPNSHCGNGFRPCI